MMPYDEDGITALVPTADCYTVLLDGKVMGRIPDSLANVFTATLRKLKVNKSDGVSSLRTFVRTLLFCKVCSNLMTLNF